jgi:hypothetical protein
MGKICTTIYLSKDNKKSSVYYSNLHLGHETAFNLYLKSMENEPNIYQQKTGIEELNAISEKIQPLKSKLKTANTISPSGIHADILGSNTFTAKQKALSVKLAKQLTAKQLLTTDSENRDKWRLLFEYANKEDIAAMEKENFYPVLRESILEDELLWKENNLEERVERNSKDFLYKWSYQTEIGSQLHDLIKDYFKLKQKLKNKNTSDLSDKERSVFFDHATGKFKNNEMISYYLNNLNKDVAEQRDNMKTILAGIEKYFEANNLTNARFSSEISVNSEKLDIFGDMDLLVTDENDVDHIFDFKFKEKGKEGNFNSQMLGPMPGIFSHLFNNKRTQHDLQLSAYRYVLEEEHGRTVAGAKIFYFEGNFDYPKRDKNGNITEYKITGVSLLDPVNLHESEYLRNDIEKYLKSKGREIGVAKNVEPDKINSVSELISNISGRENFYTYKNKKDRIRNFINKAVKLDTDLRSSNTGKKYFYNRFSTDANGKREYFDINATDSEIYDRISEHITKQENDLEGATRDLINYHKKRSLGWPSKDRQENYTEQAVAILSGLDDSTETTPNHWKLTQVKNIVGFDDVPPNILLATNSETDESRLISIGNQNSVDFYSKKENKNLFASKNKDDKAFIKEYGVELEEEGRLVSNSVNHQLIQLALIGMDLKRQGKVRNDVTLRHGVLNGIMRQDKPMVADLNEMATVLRIVDNETKKEQSTYLKDLFKFAKKQEGKIKSAEYLKTFIKTIDKFTDKLTITEINKIKDLSDLYLTDAVAKEELLKELISLNNSLMSTLQKTSQKAITFRELQKNKRVKLLANTIIELSELCLDSKILSKRINVNSGLKTPGSFNHEIMQQVGFLDRTVQQEMMRKFNEFAAKQKMLVNALIEKKGLKIASYTNSDLLELFKDLYKVNPLSMDKNTKFEEAYILKDESEVDSQAEKDYIRFFNESVLEGFEMTLSPDKFERVKDGKHWIKGTVPLQKASIDNKIARESNYWNKIKEMKSGLFVKGQKKTNALMQDLYRTINNEFEEQATADTIQNGPIRQKLLGIDENGVLVDNEAPMLETNLEEILLRFYGNSLKTSFYNSTLGIINALQIALTIHNDENFKDTEKLSEVIADYTSLQIHNEVADEGQAGKVLRNASKIANVFQMALSVKTAIQEFAQGLFAGGSYFIDQGFGKIFGNEVEISPESWLKSNAYYTMSKAPSVKKGVVLQTMCQWYGWWNDDMNMINMNHNKASKGKNVFQMKNLFVMPNIVNREFRMGAFVGRMMEDGIINNNDDDAFEVNHTTGEVIYNPKKDKRFAEAFDSSGKLRDFNDNTLTDIQRDKVARYTALKKELELEENGVDNNGIIRRPYSNADAVVMKDKVNRVFGSMSRESQVGLQKWSISSLFLKYKNWIPIKLDNYWTSATSMSMRSKMVKVQNPDNPNDPNDFTYVRKEQMGEGIIQTLMYIGKDGLGSLLKMDTTVLKELSTERKANLRKLLADLLMTIMLMAIFKALSNIELFKENKAAKLALSAFNNSASDLNIVLTGDYFLGGSPIATYSTYKNVLINFGNVLYFTAQGEGAKAAESASRMTALSKQFKDVLID